MLMRSVYVLITLLHLFRKALDYCQSAYKKIFIHQCQGQIRIMNMHPWNTQYFLNYFNTIKGFISIHLITFVKQKQMTMPYLFCLLGEVIAIRIKNLQHLIFHFNFTYRYRFMKCVFFTLKQYFESIYAHFGQIIKKICAFSSKIEPDRPALANI